MKRAIVMVENYGTVIVEYKASEERAFVDEVLTKGCSASDKEFNYFFPARRVLEVRLPRD